MLRFAFPVVLLFLSLFGCTVSPGVDMPDGRNRVVDIVNDTAVPVAIFQATRARSRDTLGNITIAPRGYASVNFDDGSGACIFDFLATFTDGETVRLDNADVCALSVWRIHQ